MAVWNPSAEVRSRANIAAQMTKYGIATYEEFLARAVADPDWFWRAFFNDAGIAWPVPYTETVDLTRGAAWAQWFRGGRINWTAAALDDHIARGDGERIAISAEREDGEVRRITYRELRDEVNRLANALRKLGVAEGDRVALWLPFVPEVAIALLATARIGAIVVPIFSGYGADAAAVRLNDSEARVVITADVTMRKGKSIAMKETVDAALAQCASVSTVVVVERSPGAAPMRAGRDIAYRALVDGCAATLDVATFDPETPWMLIYTSGTTGKPKGAVHVHGGFPMKAAQDMFHVFDVKPADTVAWLTDIGWMMGPWLISGGLLLGATVMMFDGAPDTPAPDRVWTMVERHGISILGITPTLIRALMKEGNAWPAKHAMPTLRAIGSTGEPWNPDAWVWTFEQAGKKRAPIINYSGGTEVSGGILACTVMRPLDPCVFNTPNPGIDAACVNDEGKDVRGEIGLLAIRSPNPGMTRGFWRDPERYEETYWSRWPGVWYHGDLARVDEQGYWYILGRADDTMKIAGKRVGPAELESALARHPAVVESAVIGVPDELKGQAAVAFVVVRAGYEPGEALRAALAARVAEEMGKSFTPAAIHFVGDLPKTRNAKVMRRVVRAVYLGESPGDLSALENPSAVNEVARYRTQG